MPAAGPSPEPLGPANDPDRSYSHLSPGSSQRGKRKTVTDSTTHTTRVISKKFLQFLIFTTAANCQRELLVSACRLTLGILSEVRQHSRFERLGSR